jgi:hypothetical protein
VERAEAVNLIVRIVRFVSAETQPGIVACEFLDAQNRIHTIIDKVPIFAVESLDERDSYPLPGVVRCEILASWRDAEGRELTRITTRCDGVESTEGLSEFVVLGQQVR